MRSIRREWLIAIPLLILCASILAKPVPLVGGGTDDYKYLVGAHCLTCIPTNHWETRFLIVWPTGIFLHLFGSNIWSAMIFPAAASLSAAALLYKIVEREYGAVPALIASCVMVATPIFSERSMRIGVDVPELTLLLSSVFVLQRRWWPGWAGILLALAVLSRPTQLAAFPMLAALVWITDRSRFNSFVAGLIAVILLDIAAYWVLIGDPLHFWRLALFNVQSWHQSYHPSSYIAADVDTSKSPLFNPAFIGGWQPSAGVKAPWPVQGLINLMVNRDIAVTLWAGILFSVFSLRRLDRIQIAAIISAALYFGALTYAFAIDPRPRMYLPIVAIAAMLTGSLAPSLWVGPKRILVVGMLALVSIAGIGGIRWRNDHSAGAKAAVRLMSNGPYELTRSARERMALLAWNPKTSPGHLIDIQHHCKPIVYDRPLIARSENICIYE